MDIITLLDDYVRGLLEAEEVFLTDLGQFPKLEQTVSDLSRRMAADFLSLVLTNADEIIRSSGLRESRYTAQRRVTRTLISTLGDISFQETVFRERKTGKYRRLLGELLRLPDRERFTTLAEAKLLNEAEVHSYQHAADSLTSKEQRIKKVTVMNKVHAVEETIPEMNPPSEDEVRQNMKKYLKFGTHLFIITIGLAMPNVGKRRLTMMGNFNDIGIDSELGWDRITHLLKRSDE